MYKLNIHAHSSYYSDGFDTLGSMYEQYKREEFPVAVFTDHVYSYEPIQFMELLQHPSMNKQRYEFQKDELDKLSKQIGIPYIQGIELYLPHINEEMLIFGQAAILRVFNELHKFTRGTIHRWYNLRKYYQILKDIHSEEDCIFILCHPRLDVKWLITDEYDFWEYFDGYEHYNASHGGNRFISGLRDKPSELKKKPAFCNSDAHDIRALWAGYNLVEEEITTEEALIKYVKERKPIKMIHRTKEV